jgi:trans-aconitate methyltransferase
MVLNNQENKAINSYEDKNVHTYYDVDEFKILSQARSLILEQLSEEQAKKTIDPTVFTGTVVDVGCGTGSPLLELSEKFHFSKMVGLEPSSEMLKIAKSKLPELIDICDSGSNLHKHFPEPVADLLNFHFVFSFLDYKNLIAQAAKTIKKNGILSICTTTSHSFAYIQSLAEKHGVSLAKHLFKLDLPTLKQKYVGLMPKNPDNLIDVVEKNHFQVLTHKTMRAKVTASRAREAWKFIHNAGWFTAELQNSSISQFKISCIFYYIKMLTLIHKHQSVVEDEIEVVILTAKRLD